MFIQRSHYSSIEWDAFVDLLANMKVAVENGGSVNLGQLSHLGRRPKEA